MVRSYLGKAYHEEKRAPLDEREYVTASEVDPKDPTPWFYGAIAKQTANRPVEALHDLERAMALNDNRAVYRSRLLLDGDLAARSASLGRVYSDLGFQQLALVEGWKSVNTDPTNFSAHRFLADSYSVLPRHEIARVSELLQAQLLQPLNITPLQPQLAESNLFLVSSSGPGGLSFNEFNPVFNRDRVAVQLSGLGGQRGAAMGEAVAAGIYRNASFSAGFARLQTDGFRANADQENNIANAFAQLELTSSTSLQAEYRYRDGDQGDLTQSFDPEVFSRTSRTVADSHTFRIGGRHAFGPESVVLGSFIYQRASTTQEVPDEFFGPGSLFTARTPQRAAGAELQHLLRSRYFNLRTGAGYFDVASKFDYTSVLPPFAPGEPPLVLESTEDADTRHRNVYAYADVRPVRQVTVTAGAEWDSLVGDLRKDQLNPKLGVVYHPFPATTIRAAAFRTLKRTLITNQTIEPTQVAGFNQFFDDVDLTEARRYGVALDQKLTASLFGGVELSRRALSVPFTFLDATDPMAVPVDMKASWREDLARAYVFWTPHRWWAVGGEYSLERSDRDEKFGAGISELDTHRVPLALRLFHPSGLSAAVTGTYWSQRGKFQLLPEPSGRDDFWILDAAVSYRLPRRHGVVSVAATNLFDRQFKYFEVDYNNPRIQPIRRVFARVTVPLP